MQGLFFENSQATTTLIFLHGWCCSIEDFSEQIQYFKNNYSILVPDYSQAVIEYTGPEDKILEKCTSELKYYVQSYNLKNFILIGHSMGGILALTLSQYLKPVKSIIIDTSLIVSDSYKNFINLLRLDKTHNTITELIENRWISPKHDNLELMQNKKDDVLKVWKQSSHNFINILEQAMIYDKIDTIKQLPIPILYIGSHNNDINSLDLLIHTKHNFERQKILSGHFIMLNAPGKLNILIETFINK